MLEMICVAGFFVINTPTSSQAMDPFAVTSVSKYADRIYITVHATTLRLETNTPIQDLLVAISKCRQTINLQIDTN